MSRTLTRLTVVVLVLAMLVGIAGVARANPSSESGHGKGNKHVSVMFGDVSLEDFPWAFKHIEKMAAKGIIKGVGDGIFNGNAAIKHEEAAIMIVRYLGLEDEAQAAMKATLPFSDAEQVDSWARGYVKVALDRNLLWMPDSGQITQFQPSTSTSRVEAVVMLVKAAGLEAEARAKANQRLTFKDAATIPTAYIGYVAVGVERGLVKGYDDNTFQPFKAVKRAEMATFLGRTDETIPHPGNDDEINGQFVSATATTITVLSTGRQSTYRLAANCPVYLNDELADLTDLRAGDAVELELDAQDRVIFIDAEGSGNVTPTPLTITGTVKSLSIRSGTPSTITVTLAGNAGDRAYAIATNCVIKINGDKAALADIQVGDSVTLKLLSAIGEQVTEIAVTRNEVTSVTGVVKGLSIDATSRITVRPDGKTTNSTYDLATNCVIKVNGAVSSLAAANIVVGDTVQLKLSNSKVTEINVIRNQVTSVTGVVKGLSIDTTSRITVRPDGKTSNSTYDLATNCVIKVNGAVSSLAAANIVVGDTVQLKLTNGKVTEINVAREQISTVSGTVQAFSINTGTNSTITVLPNGQTTGTSYLLATNVTVKYVDHVVPLSEIKVGDKVTLTIVNQSGIQVVSKIDIASRETVTNGTVTGINYDARTLTVVKNSVTTTYAVAANAVVTLFDQSFTWNHVTLNDAVTLTLVDNTVTRINITVHNATYTGTVKSVTVDAAGNHFVATISGTDRAVDVPTAAVITHAGQPGTFGDVTIGATVTITGAFDGTKIVASAVAVQ